MPLPIAASLRLSTSIALAAVMAGAAAQAPSARPAIESFFANPVLDAPVLSPNARFVALRAGEPGKRDRLAVIDVATNTMTSVAAFADGDVGRIQWVNDNRLVFDTHDSQSAQGDREYAPGLYAIDRDGKNFVQLVDRAGEGGRVQTGSMIKSSKHLPWHTFLLDQVGRQDSDSIYVESHSYDSDWEVANVRLIQLNTRTMQTTNLTGPPRSHGFLLDNNGEPRLAVTHERDQQTIHHRDSSSGAWKQWGKAMQDDIADGVKWVVAQGIADPARVCIAGASYGGYSTLMGLVNDPGLYKCGISWAGVTDIDLLFTGSWGFMSDMSSRYRRYGMPELVGDPVKDAAQFKATSPLQQAARIMQPLMLAYGGADKRVPLYHGEKFHDAVKKTNPNVEWIEYHAEGHGWVLPENRIDFWTRVEKFLGRHIGTP